MRHLINSVLAVFGAAAITSASDVYDLKMDNFDSFIKEKDLVLAECESSECSQTRSSILLILRIASLCGTSDANRDDVC